MDRALSLVAACSRVCMSFQCQRLSLCNNERESGATQQAQLTKPPAKGTPGWTDVAVPSMVDLAVAQVWQCLAPLVAWRPVSSNIGVVTERNFCTFQQHRSMLCLAATAHLRGQPGPQRAADISTAWRHLLQGWQRRLRQGSSWRQLLSDR